MSVKNERIVKKIIEMFTGNNHASYIDYLAGDIKWNIVGMPLICGKDEFIKAVKSLELENFSSSKIKNIISDREFVVVESTGQANIQMDGPNAPAYCDIYLIRNSKICELTTYIIDTTLNNEH